MLPAVEHSRKILVFLAYIDLISGKHFEILQSWPTKSLRQPRLVDASNYPLAHAHSLGNITDRHHLSEVHHHTRKTLRVVPAMSDSG
jgi:hypothetical protein